MVKIGKKKNLLGKIPFQLAALLVLAVVFSLGSALSKQLYREYRIQKEIESLKTEIEGMEKDNYELSQLIEYYQTDEYKEAEARRRLNLKAEGEKVVMIDEKKNAAEDLQSEEDAKNGTTPNYQKWWNYFFASRNDL